MTPDHPEYMIATFGVVIVGLALVTVFIDVIREKIEIMYMNLLNNQLKVFSSSLITQIFCVIFFHFCGSRAIRPSKTRKKPFLFCITTYKVFFIYKILFLHVVEPLMCEIN